jgi:hypothetical protein
MPDYLATFVDDPDHWRARADYIRMVAGIVVELHTKSRMFRIAADYDHLAKRAEERLLNVTLP